MDYLEALQNIKENAENAINHEPAFTSVKQGVAIVTNDLMRLRGYSFYEYTDDMSSQIKQQAIVTAAHLVKLLIYLK